MKTSDFQRTILVQYANAETLLEILGAMNCTIDPEIDINEQFAREIDLDTCGTHGLDVWGIIVAAPRTIAVESTDYFGFRDSTLQPFDQAPFCNGKRVSEIYRLENTAYRRLIYFKAMINIMSTTLPNIDAILRMYFRGKEGRWDVYSQEIGLMKMRVVFRFMLTPVERAIFRTYGNMMRPGGVGIEFREIPYETFGFLGSDLLPFNVGTFYNGAITAL